MTRALSHINPNPSLLPHSTCANRAHLSNDDPSLSYIDQGWDFSYAFDSLDHEYRNRRHPVEVNFRKLVPFNSGIDRVTHLIHSYPAKLLLNIPLFFLRCEQVGTKGHLRDPFCGSGTVLLEGILAGWRVTGADVNPLARLITEVKLTPLEPDVVLEAANRVCGAWQERIHTFAPVVNVDYWFSKVSQRQLGGLLAAIAEEDSTDIRQFLSVCLSSCIRKASFADPRFSVPVRTAPSKTCRQTSGKHDVIRLFTETIRLNSRRLGVLNSLRAGIAERGPITHDARLKFGSSTTDDVVDLIITSPPYGGAQKYIRASSLNLGWLNLAPGDRLRPLEGLTIGREHYRKAEYRDLELPPNGIAHEQLKRLWSKNPLRGHIASRYLIEMNESLRGMFKALRRNGKMVMVLGNNTVLGETFETATYVKEMALEVGLDLQLELVDTIRSRSLMTKRSQTAGIITKEYVQMYRKP